MQRYYVVFILLALLLSGCGGATSGGPAPQPPQPATSAVAATPAAAATSAAAAGAATPASAAGAVQVEIGYLSHPPVRGVLDQVDKLLASYGPRVSVARYDFETAEGADFTRAKNLTGHTPLAIFINGSMQFTVRDRQVSFYSFPSGDGTHAASGGEWTLDDLKQVLDQATGSLP